MASLIENTAELDDVSFIPGLINGYMGVPQV